MADVRILGSGDPEPDPDTKKLAESKPLDWMTDDERAFEFLGRDEGTVLSELLALMAAPPTEEAEREAARSFTAALKKVEASEANRGPVMERLFAYEVLLKGTGKPKEKAAPAEPKKAAKKDDAVVGAIGKPKPSPAPAPSLGLESVRAASASIFAPAVGDDLPVPVVFEATPYEAGLISQALSHRKDDLDKLAKKTGEEGYPTEARRIGNDAGTIGEVILPRFRAQQELALATPVEVRGAIANRLRETVRRALVKKDPDIEAALGAIAGLVEPLLTGAVDRGYAAGLAARHHDPNVIILKAIEAAATAKFEET